MYQYIYCKNIYSGNKNRIYIIILQIPEWKDRPVREKSALKIKNDTRIYIQGRL
jgi:hypothetical protein